MKTLRIAAFGGFRSIPPKAGGAGSDKFAYELYPRFVQRGHSVVAYTRIYKGDTTNGISEYKGIKIIPFKTVNKAGFDTLLHSLKATMHIIFKNTADVVHIHSGANSMWAFLLRSAGKKVFVSQFAMDWKRDKWPWYGKLFYLISNYLTAYFPNAVIFDNIFNEEFFEQKFKKRFYFIPYGAEVPASGKNTNVLKRLGLGTKEYFLFVGRFIPDKGIHFLLDAFEKIDTNKKIVLVGGSPNPSSYEVKLKETSDERIIFPGYIYGEDTNVLMKNAYAYVQPSLIEGLSPVILTVMGLGTPLICSDIRENIYIVKENATLFKAGSVTDLYQKLSYSLAEYKILKEKADSGRKDILKRFNWDSITNQFIDKFQGKTGIEYD
jgi:glycosyltransferase involved in cell wall biosynthesis